MSLFSSLAIGVVAGLRSMSAPAAASWAAETGIAPVEGTALSFMGHSAVASKLTVLAAGEILADPLPFMPSRKQPPAFAARIASGALSGATLSATDGGVLLGAVCGVIGAVAGTLGGASLRSRLAERIGADLPAALIEDAIVAGLILAAVKHRARPAGDRLSTPGVLAA